MASIHFSAWSSACHGLRRSLSYPQTSRLISLSLQPYSSRSLYGRPHIIAAVSFRGFASDKQLQKKDARKRLPSISTGYANIKGFFHRVSAAGRAVTSVLSGVSAASGALTSVYSRFSQTSYGRLMRLDKPIGTHLLFLPGAWGISIASSSPTEVLSLCGLFYGGAVLMRGAGCTINDIWDVDIDRKVERTKSRPLAANEISTPAAFVFLGAQLSGALLVLTQLNTETFLVGTMALLPVIFYPLAKRHTPYPQAVLGLTLNWGALMGYSAVTGTLGTPALFLYGAGWCWTMVYDTIYAFQDKVDDERIGVHSTARTFARNTKPVLAAFTAGKVALLTGAGIAADLSTPYFMGISASAIHLAYQVYATDLSNSEQCQKAFNSNSITGAVTLASIVAGRVF